MPARWTSPRRATSSSTQRPALSSAPAPSRAEREPWRLAPARQQAAWGCSAIEEGGLLETHPGQDLLYPFVGERPDVLAELRLLDRGHLRDDQDALSGQIAFPHVEQHIARFARPLQ